MPTRTFKELRDEFVADPDQAALLAEVKRDREAEQAIYKMSMARVRRARAYTREQLVRSLPATQAEVSHIERQASLYLSTLRSYLTAMGGELELVARIDDQRIAFSLDDVITDDIAGETTAEHEVARITVAAPLHT